jgi:hypothetical protein
LENICLELNVNRKPKLGGTQTPSPLEVSWKQKCKMRKWAESRNSNGAVVVVLVVTVILTELT